MPSLAKSMEVHEVRTCLVKESCNHESEGPISCVPLLHNRGQMTLTAEGHLKSTHSNYAHPAPLVLDATPTSSSEITMPSLMIMQNSKLSVTDRQEYSSKRIACVCTHIDNGRRLGSSHELMAPTLQSSTVNTIDSGPVTQRATAGVRGGLG